ncbi:SURF1 family protein [Sphingomonas sp. H39-1-10]|uniref:SURF1 family cytochrome oxidase biogenesis protein n=1 Tax=Sphingomonas pollutisoli TaxID=3030829 RepID=UPI0023B922CF|nr:SURF1 family cytochrome oxidase biogenesis protein [Sphingomonas pollutisoli]MDF0487115.1 SURF1 family protein [Sphingomonas pollutisoli]
MRRRVPVLATTLVALAIAAMIALGVWQLQRRAEKAALLARLAANRDLPPIAFPRVPIGDDLLFRRAEAFCLRPVGWRAEGGHDAVGKPGWRQIAQCRTGAEGPGFAVQIGVAGAPNAKPAWGGGAVRGYLAHAPDHQPLIAGLFGHAPKPLMLVADPPLAGLAANPPADLSSVPNNHLAYAVQWFVFAGVAAVIYGLALRKRGRS